jgi:glycosyltransferase involved in cell wall biosynthesis
MFSQAARLIRLMPGLRSVVLTPSRGRRPAGRRPRVLMFVESSSGGTGRHVLDLSEGLARRGWDVHVLFSTGRADRFFLERAGSLTGVRSLPLFMRTSIHPSDFSAVLAARRYLQEFGPFDLVHGHSSKGGAIARLAALGKGIPAVYTLHGFIVMDPGLARWKRAFYLAIELILSRRTARVVAVAPEEERAAVRFGLGRSRVVLVPNGVGAAEVAPRAEARKLIGAGEGELVIGFVGRLVEQKAPEVLVRAMCRVTAAAPLATLAVVGAGPLERPLRELAARLGVAERILWLGEQDARSVMAGFDVLAIPSRKEGLPYVALEAMSAGLPVVATDSAGVESLVQPGVNGEVVPRGDVDAFGAALVSLASDPAKLARYGAGSLQRVAQFSIDRMVERTLETYLDVLEGRDAPQAGHEAAAVVATSGASAAAASGMPVGVAIAREADPS